MHNFNQRLIEILISDKNILKLMKTLKYHFPHPLMLEKTTSLYN